MTIQIITPQFDRVDDVTVNQGPTTLEAVEALKTLSPEALRALGCGLWTETEEHRHWLFPKEWYNDIPDGMMVEVISGDCEKFVRGETDDDTRFGLLAFGFFQPLPETEQA